jgi:hypothetical protein
MQAPPRKPTREDRDVIIIPEAREPRRPGVIAAVALGVVAALLLGTLGGYFWGHRQVSTLEASVASTQQASLADKAALVAAAQARVDELNKRIADLTAAYQRSRQQVSLLLSSRQEGRRRIVELEAQLADAQGQLTKAQGQANHPGGPPLSDGTHIGMILALSASASPPRLVLDPGRWYTGHAAHAAAVAHGVIGPTETLPHHRYFQNLDGGWRTTPMVAGARVTLWHWRGHLGARVVSIGRLQRVLSSGAPWAVRVQHNPFWITVVDGQITIIREQRYP